MCLISFFMNIASATINGWYSLFKRLKLCSFKLYDFFVVSSFCLVWIMLDQLMMPYFSIIYCKVKVVSNINRCFKVKTNRSNLIIVWKISYYFFRIRTKISELYVSYYVECLIIKNLWQMMLSWYLKHFVLI